MRYLLIAATLLWGGCALPVSPPQAEATHTLELQTQTSIASPVPAGRTLLVAPLTAAPGYGGPAMAYFSSAHELRYFANQRWVDRPARLVEQALLDGLSASGASVVAAGTGAQPDYRLVTDLVQLAQDFTSTPSRTRLVLRVQLVDVRERRLLGSETLRLEQLASSDDAAGGVVAANALLEQAVGAVAAFCQRAAAP